MPQLGSSYSQVMILTSEIVDAFDVFDVVRKTYFLEGGWLEAKVRRRQSFFPCLTYTPRPPPVVC